MLWIIEESDDCGVRWRRAELTDPYQHPGVALLEALAIIKDEWRPPTRAMRELRFALEHDSVTYFWDKGIRIVRARDGQAGQGSVPGMPGRAM